MYAMLASGSVPGAALARLFAAPKPRADPYGRGSVECRVSFQTKTKSEMRNQKWNKTWNLP
jgi:hypothetical protein